MSLTTVTGTILDPSDNPIVGATVEAILASDQGAYLLDDSAEILSRTTTTTDAAGAWSMALIPNAEISPSGTGYEVTRLVNLRAQVDTINVPVSGSPVAFASIIVDPAVVGGLAAGGVLAGTYPNPTFADADVTALAALGDGYPRRASGTWAARTSAQVADDVALSLMPPIVAALVFGG